MADELIDPKHHDAPEVDAEQAQEIASYLFEIGTLKHQKRTGWWIAGIKDPESVAEHSFRTSVLATILAAAEGCDPARASHMAVFHDSQETRVGDIPHVGRRYLTAASNELITADQVARMPQRIAAVIAEIVTAYEEQDSPEAVIAKDADKLECLLQGLEYQRRGFSGVQEWIDNCRAALKSATAIAIADAATGLTGIEWQRTQTASQ